MLAIGSNKPFSDINKASPQASPDEFYNKDSSLRKQSKRRITFYKNGDRYFNGKTITIRPTRYVTFRELMNDLNRTVDLPYGVRRIFTPTGGRELHDVDELADGSSYVCGSFEPFRAVKYGDWTDKPWNGHLCKCFFLLFDFRFFIEFI